MTTSDALSLLAIVISVGSFGITIYEQYGKRPALAVELGSNVSLSYGEGHANLGATLSVAVINTGAHDTIVTDMAGTLARRDGTWKVPIVWYQFYVPADAGKLGKTSEPWFKFDGWASPIIAPSRKATAKSIFFNSDLITDVLGPGDYSVVLAITARPGPRRAARASYGFTIDDQQATELRDNCVGGPTLDFRLTEIDTANEIRQRPE